MDERMIRAHALDVLVADRIHELWTRRRWYATHVGWVPEQQTEDRAELHYLVALARRARDMAAPAVERADPVTQAQAFDDEGTAYPADYFAGDHYVYPVPRLATIASEATDEAIDAFLGALTRDEPTPAWDR